MPKQWPNRLKSLQTLASWQAKNRVEISNGCRAITLKPGTQPYRKIDGVWYYRDPAAKIISRFAVQDCVIPLRRNIVSDDR